MRRIASKRARKGAVAVVALVGALVLGACSTSAPAENLAVQDVDEERTVNFFSPMEKISPDTENTARTASDLTIAMAEERLGLTLAYHTYTAENYQDKTYDEVCLERARNNSDDLYLLNTDTIVTLGSEGHLADLSGLSCAQNLREVVRAANTVDGKLVAIPQEVVAYGLFVNKDIFDECELSLPNTPEEFLECCRVLKEKGYETPIGANRWWLETFVFAQAYADLYNGGDVAAEVQRQLTAGCEPASLKRRMMSMIKLEKNPLLRAAPLIVKDAALAIADARAVREVTTTVSSLGRVALDPCMAPYVEGISALTSTSGLNFIVCTYGDDLSIGISSRFLGQKVTRALAEVLEDEGMRGYLNANRDAPAFHRPGPLAAARKAAPVPSVFPPNSFERKSTRVRTVLAVLTLICIALIALLGGTAGGSALAVGAPCAAVALNWLFVRNMIVHAPDFIRVVERYFLVLLAVAGLWFLSTGNLIVTTYVIPGLCLLALAFNAVLLIAFRGSFVTGYAKYLIYEMLLGLVPLALLAAGLITWPPLAIAAGAAAAALLAILLLVGRKQLAAEARKLFSLR